MGRKSLPRLRRAGAYLSKVCGVPIDFSREAWARLILYQELRHHLAHFGSGFRDSPDHERKAARFVTLSGVRVDVGIEFEDGGIGRAFDDLLNWYDEVIGGFPALPANNGELPT